MSDPVSPSTATLLEEARSAARSLARSSGVERQAALRCILDELSEARSGILLANSEDVSAARTAGMSGALMDRLILTEPRFEAMLQSVQEVIALPDPLGEERKPVMRPNGLRVFRRRVPLGVLAIIYEARPNVTIEAAALALKSGNAIVLRGGREARRSNAALVQAVQSGLQRAALPGECVQRLDDDSRERVKELLEA